MRPSVGSCLVLAALLAGCGARKPASDWQVVPIGTDAAFADICFSDSLNGWIIGGGWNVEGGLVGRTRDGGRTWEYTSRLVRKRPGVTTFGLQAAHFSDSLEGLVVASGGIILKTDDGGRNWRVVRHGRSVADHLFDVEMHDRQLGWAVGLGGVLRTTDGGEHWAPLGLPGESMQRRPGHAIDFIDAHRGFKVWQHGELETTNDGGFTWTRRDLPLPDGERPYLFDVHFSDTRHGWIVGENGTILHTGDGGGTWAIQDTGLPDAKERPRPPGSVPGPPEMAEIEGPLPGIFLTRVRFLDERRGWTVGFWRDQGRSVVLGTRDGGVTWAVEAEAPGEELRALTVDADGRAWTVGDRSRTGDQTLLLRTASALSDR